MLARLRCSTCCKVIDLRRLIQLCIHIRPKSRSVTSASTHMTWVATTRLARPGLIIAELSTVLSSWWTLLNTHVSKNQKRNLINSYRCLSSPTFPSSSSATKLTSVKLSRRRSSVMSWDYHSTRPTARMPAHKMQVFDLSKYSCVALSSVPDIKMVSTGLVNSSPEQTQKTPESILMTLNKTKRNLKKGVGKITHTYVPTNYELTRKD